MRQKVASPQKLNNIREILSTGLSAKVYTLK